MRPADLPPLAPERAPDVLEIALARTVAQCRKDWQSEAAAITAECRTILAECKTALAELKAAVLEQRVAELEGKKGKAR